MTVFEKIKQMTPNEMANFLADITDCDSCPARHLCDKEKYIGCDEIFDLWLDSFRDGLEV